MFSKISRKETVNPAQGLLEIKSTDKIISATVGVEAEVSRLTPGKQIALFDAPPELKNNKYVCKGEPERLLEKGHPVLSRPYHVKNEKGQLVDTGYVHVALYEVDNEGMNSDLPESGKGIKIIKEGYIKKDHVKLINGFKLTKKENLFVKKPSINDIQQGSEFGDCFLLAALNGIMSREGGPELIMSMIKQEGDTAYVRLFDPKTNQPLICKVGMSEFHKRDSGNSTVHHHQPWVHMIEKAYAGLGYGSNSKETYPSFRAIYGKGGSIEQALKVLTGQAATTQLIERRIVTPWNDDNMVTTVRMQCLRTDGNNDKFFENLKNTLVELDVNPMVLEMVEKVFNKDPANLNLWFDFLAKIKTVNQSRLEEIKNHPAGQELFKNLTEKQIVEKLKEITTPPIGQQFDTNFIRTINEYLKFKEIRDNPSGQQFDAASYTRTINELLRFNESHFDGNPAIKSILKNYTDLILPKSNLATKAVVAASTGTGIYSTYQNQLFDKIKGSLERNCPVTCGMGNTENHNAFYEIDEAQGLHAQHAYTIIGCREETNQLGKNSKIITLANPWGEGGAKYLEQYGSLILTSSSNGQFSIDLNDLTRFASDVQIGQPIDRNLKNQVVFAPEKARAGKEFMQNLRKEDPEINMENRATFS
ncbi:Calpain family cysteine protease [Legionella massiliensis]|uniref:Calpain family cysteine protease n=1 Tax=Legionella massiliensis TaxID=1034943 RepID=A0A078KUY5_9GAMM|nr:C2 family cysteine protease [Legionella massiliensis]CDZ76846.1 Calpain family cysteine protease [Legionella massiliensis]CEE12584.1 Calpain family cysteine protease [Legionella massiliensis]